MQNGDVVREYLLKSTGQRTVPNVFIRGNHIGGCDGKFDSILVAREAPSLFSKHSRRDQTFDSFALISFKFSFKLTKDSHSFFCNADDWQNAQTQWHYTQAASFCL